MKAGSRRARGLPPRYKRLGKDDLHGVCDTISKCLIRSILKTTGVGVKDAAVCGWQMQRRVRDSTISARQEARTPRLCPMITAYSTIRTTISQEWQCNQSRSALFAVACLAPRVTLRTFVQQMGLGVATLQATRFSKARRPAPPCPSGRHRFATRRVEIHRHNALGSG